MLVVFVCGYHLLFIYRIVNHSLTLNYNSIWRSPRLCINAQLMVSVAENSHGPAQRRG